MSQMVVGALALLIASLSVALLCAERRTKARRAQPRTRFLGDASEDFMCAFADSGSICILCEMCGRTYFLDGPADFEDGELEELRAQAAADPERFVGVDDYTSWGYWNGKQLVIGCACGSDALLERMVWHGRYWITSYLRRRASLEADLATDMAECAAGTERATEAT